MTYVNWVNVAFMETAHMSIRKKTIGEKREKHKLRQGQQFIAGQCKSGTPKVTISIATQFTREEALTGGRARYAHLRQYLYVQKMLAIYNFSRIYHIALVPPSVLIGGPPVCWTWVMMLEAPPAAAIA